MDGCAFLICCLFYYLLSPCQHLSHIFLTSHLGFHHYSSPSASTTHNPHSHTYPILHFHLASSYLLINLPPLFDMRLPNSLPFLAILLLGHSKATPTSPQEPTASFAAIPFSCPPSLLSKKYEPACCDTMTSKGDKGKFEGEECACPSPFTIYFISFSPFF